MKTYKWVNTYHRTTATSTLNEEALIDIDHRIYGGLLTSKDSEYRKYKTLVNKLCPSAKHGCQCVRGRVVE